ncbi:hypothetical protein N0B44_03965 [Roseibacterium beibuensis]|uniref:N-acetyltransferase domain-containing protein n=1 Tax=[Roseibacterium] beibuensis TaxID=1193142 RepID=A0ABP9KV12_9RHOB|nr:hypothetical protein [Roseibacterium beibuensis]
MHAGSDPSRAARGRDIVVVTNPDKGARTAYLKLLSDRYRERIGTDLRDEAVTLPATSHLFLCVRQGEVVGGMQVAVAGPDEALPCEDDGVLVGDYHAARFPNRQFRAEVLRNVSARGAGGLVQYALLGRLSEALKALGCNTLYWLADERQTTNSHRVVRALGGMPERVDTYVLTRKGNPAARKLVLSVADITDWTAPADLPPVQARAGRPKE